MKIFSSIFLTIAFICANLFTANLCYSQTISTIAGNGSGSFSGDGGLATSATVNRPLEIHVDATGNIFIVDSDNHKTKRETYQFYKETMLNRGEIPLGIGRFGKLFAEYFEDSIEKIETGRTMRVWLNIDFKKPQQVELEKFHC